MEVAGVVVSAHYRHFDLPCRRYLGLHLVIPVIMVDAAASGYLRSDATMANGVLL